MTVTSPYQTAAEQLAAIIDAEYAPEGFVVEHDNIHESLGSDGRTRLGLAPMYDIPQARDLNVQETWIEFRFYGGFDKKVDPNQSVDPRIVTTFAERFRRAIKASYVPSNGTPGMWFYTIERIEYPNDATGNKTRFVARVCAYGQNSGLVETTG